MGLWQGVAVDSLKFSAVSYPCTPCGRASPTKALQVFQGWPARKTGGLRPSSAPLNNPRRSPMEVTLKFCSILEFTVRITIRYPLVSSMLPFLGAKKRLYKRLRPSVGLSVRWLIGPSPCYFEN
jgi:hypothetical protein